MNTATSLSTAADTTAQGEAGESLLRSWTRFWFAPIDPVGLHVVRLLSGLLFLGWLLPFAGFQDSFFGLQGWFDRQAYADASRLPNGPPTPIGWSLLFLCGSSSTLLATAYWGSVVVLALFTLGICTRVTAVLTWLIVVSFTANPGLAYDADPLLVMLAFYLMLGYLFLGQSQPAALLTRLFGSRDTLLLGPPANAVRITSVGANVALRLLQANLALMLVFSGLHKLQYLEWWAGTAFWFPLNPPLETTLVTARKFAGSATLYLFVMSLTVYIALAWQLAFPLFAWKARWRPLLLLGAFLGMLGTAFVYRLPLFGQAVFIGCLSFVSATGWHRLRSWAARIFGRAAEQQPALERRQERLVSAVKVGQR